MPKLLVHMHCTMHTGIEDAKKEETLIGTMWPDFQMLSKSFPKQCQQSPDLKESLAAAESKADAAEESLALEINDTHESSVSSLANVQQKLEASVANVQQKLEASVRELGVELQGLHQNCGIQAQEMNRDLLHAVQEVRQQGSQEMLHVVSQFHHEILKEENAAIQCVADEASDRLDECFLLFISL